MVACFILFSLQLLAFKYQVLTIRSASNFFVWTCWLIVFVLSLASGGIRSSVLPWISLIPILGLLLLGATAAWWWGVMGLVTVVFFSLADERMLISPNLIMEQNDLLTASLHVGLQFLILTLTWIFDRQQNILIAEIEAKNRELAANKAEISAQNEDLIQSKREISSNRDLVAAQNRSLKEAREIIEMQNQVLRRKNEDLEQQVSVRTQSLVDYNQQLEQFAFVASHNLRAPIARILGLGNLLAHAQSTDDEAFIKANMIKAAVDLDRVVKDISTILDIKKSSNATFAEISIPDELQMIVSTLQKDIMETNARIEFLAVPNQKIRTIRPYFHSILYNLLSNAIKYRKPDEPPLIKLTITLLDNGVRINVSDNGLGMDLNVAEDKIFKLYNRFHDHIEGKGIGLYLIKTQAEALGGKVEVESKPGEGTTFSVTIKSSVVPG